MRFQLISANNQDMFQERLNHFVASLPAHTIVVDVKFSTALQGNNLVFSALVQYKEVEEWTD